MPTIHLPHPHIKRLPSPRSILQTFWRYVPLIALALAIGGAILAYLSTSGGAGAAASSTPSPSSANHFTIGEQVKTGDVWVVTLNSAKLHDPTIFDRPSAGDTYLVLDATFKNVSSRSRILSSTLQMRLESPTGQAYDRTIVTFSSSSPDGPIAAGDLLRGQLVYEVPKGSKAFIFAFQPDIMTSGQTLWDINL